MKPFKTNNFTDIGDCARKLATDLAEFINSAYTAHGQASLAVSGGRTPEHIFPLLSQADLDWKRVAITLADERWVAPTHPDSNEGLTRRLLLQGPASAATFTGLKTEHKDPFDGQTTAETALATLGWPLDAILLGMGEDGHIASLFPGQGDWLDAPGKTLAVTALQDRQARMSLTPKALLDSRHIYLVITGPDKRATFDAALQSGSVTELPVRLILHQSRVPITVYCVD
jgi:6-phosphogluconolactonase